MILAFDTSCYTSSVALLDSEGHLLKEHRRVLDVPAKQRGLLQSEALFQHIHNIPGFIEALAAEYDFSQIKAIGCSVKPCPREGSYMPVFLGGEKIGRTVAASLGIPFIEATHQEGHMMAGWYSLGRLENIPEKYLFCHFSGGTSDVLLAENRGNGDFNLTLQAFGNDLHAGQFVDRIGVLMGLRFPCGTELEKIAESHSGDIPPVKIWVQNGEFSFSGQETALRRMYENGTAKATVARAVEHTIARTMKKVLEQTFAKTGLDTALLAGGVMCNGYIKNYLREHLNGATLYFADPRYASDNAVGIAALTLLRRGKEGF